MQFHLDWIESHVRNLPNIQNTFTISYTHSSLRCTIE